MPLPLRYNPNQTPQAAALATFQQMPAEHVAYAADEARGEFRGFAALHDLCDANVDYLPTCKACHTNDDGFLSYCNAFMDSLSALICSGVSQSMTPLLPGVTASVEWRGGSLLVRLYNCPQTADKAAGTDTENRHALIEALGKAGMAAEISNGRFEVNRNGIALAYVVDFDDEATRERAFAFLKARGFSEFRAR